MALMERVATLIRANLNDLIDRAENPEVVIKQVIVDMENQFMQVKTQVAVAIADQHLLEKKRQEQTEKSADWMRKAELAVDKQQDDLARVALENAERCRALADNFQQQAADQKAQVDTLKTALGKLEQKLAEARSKRDVLIAQHRRSRAMTKASEARICIGDAGNAAAFDRMQDKVQREEAISEAQSGLAGDNLDDRFRALERDDRIERMLTELKAQRGQKG